MKLIAMEFGHDSELYDLIGMDSIYALFLAIIFCLLTSKVFACKTLLQEERTRQVLELIAFFCLLMFYLLYGSTRFMRHYLDISFYASLYICLAFGFIFSMRVTSYNFWWCKISGGLGLLCFIYAIYAEAYLLASLDDETLTRTLILISLLIITVALHFLQKHKINKHEKSNK